MRMKDLVVLTADRNTQFALRGIVSRSNALGIRHIDADYFVHPQRDPGVLGDAHDFLRIYLRLYRYALVILDREGCGREEKTREDLEKQLQENLERNGWKDRSAAVAIDPELEIWVWTPSDHVPAILGWKGNYASLKSWLTEKNFLQPGQPKPCRPKEAMEAILRERRIPRSSALYQELAQKVSFMGCTDPAFCKLRDTLQRWFPPEAQGGHEIPSHPEAARE